MNDDPKPLRVEMSLRNNRLYRARIDAGYLTQAAASIAIGVNQSTYGRLETLRISPIGADDDWRPVALKVADFYFREPGYFWPDEMRSLKNTKTAIEVSLDDVALLCSSNPFEILANREISAALGVGIDSLTDREKLVIGMRFGIGDKSEGTFEEVSQRLALTRERIRQIEAKALRKLRHPSRANAIKSALDGCIPIEPEPGPEPKPKPESIFTPEEIEKRSMDIWKRAKWRRSR